MAQDFSHRIVGSLSGPLLALSLMGCAGTMNDLLGRAELQPVAVGVEPSGQVAVLLQAEASGQPLTQLNASSFRILEDNKPVDPAITGQTLLPIASVADFHTLVMVDLSGIGQRPDLRAQLSQAIASFVNTVEKDQGVTLYAFDGSPQPTLLGEFPVGATNTPLTHIEAIDQYQPADASRDLRGALVSGLGELNVRLMQTKKPIRLGTLVIFTQGGDLAGRVSNNAYYGSIDTTQRRVLVVHLDKATPELRRLGKDNLISATNSPGGLSSAWETAAIRVENSRSEHYVLSYCSPARGGKRLVRIEAQTLDALGKKRTGRVSVRIDSSGFGTGCDPNHSPSFQTASPSSNSSPSPAPAPIPSPGPAPAPTSAPSPSPLATPALPGPVLPPLAEPPR